MPKNQKKRCRWIILQPSAVTIAGLFLMLFITTGSVFALETNLVNSTSEARQPVLRLVGRVAYESPAGLVKNGQVYLFYDLNKDAERGGNAEVFGNSPSANNTDEVFFKPKGFVTIKAVIPKAGKYFPSIRWRQHGNAGPAIAVEINGKEAVRIGGGGGYLHWDWDTKPIDLPEGPVTIVLREACGNPGQNVNMAVADIFTLSTEKRGNRNNEVTVCPTDIKNTNWLSRLSLPLVDPSLKIGECQIQLKGTLQDGEPAWVFPDGSVASAAGLKATATGTMPKVPAGGTQTVAITDAVESSHAAELSAVFGDIKVLAVNHTVLTPNDDGVADSVRFAAADKQAEIKNAITGAMVKPSAESWKDGSFEWPGAGELSPFSYYEIAVPGFEAASRQIGVVEIRGEKPLASADPRAFSPNDDGVVDTTQLECFFMQGPLTGGVRVVDSGGRTVRQLSPPTNLVKRTIHTWDGRDDKGQTVPNGTYHFQVVKEDGEVVRATSMRANSFRKWERAPIRVEPDFFPLGVYYTVIEHPQKLTGTAYHATLFKDLKAHNLNTALISMQAVPPEVFDLAKTNGIRLITSLSGLAHGNLPLDEEKAAETIQKAIAPIEKMPELLAYYISDEPDQGNREANVRTLMCHRMIEGMDSSHPPLSCLIGLENIAHYTKILQPPVMFIDIYPLLPKAEPGDFRRMYYLKCDLTEYTNLARGNLKDDRPFWTILQAHNFNNWLRKPTPVEMRLQVACSLAYGAKGIFFFLYQPIAEMIGFLDFEFKPTPNYEAVQEVCGRVDKLAPLLLKLHALEPVAKVSGKPENKNFASVLGSFRGPEKGLYLILANSYVEGDSEMTLTFDPKKLSKDISLEDQESKEKIKVQADDAGVVAKFTMKPGDFRVFKVQGANEFRRWYEIFKVQGAIEVAPLRHWYEMSPEEQVSTRNKPNPKPNP